MRWLSALDAYDWISQCVSPIGPIERTHESSWATVLRVPLATGSAWFKACERRIQAFEPRLTAELFTRWPSLIPKVLAWDAERSWVLLADAGKPIAELGNPPKLWLELLPMYAEMQRTESVYVDHHMNHGVPDLRVAMLPARYEELLEENLPIQDREIFWLRRYARHFAQLCGDLDGSGVPETIQHDDLHMNNVFVNDATNQGRLRVLDWGDACVSHPFVSAVATFRFLEELNRLPSDDPWFTRLRDAYLEGWGRGFVPTFKLAYKVGAFAYAIAAMRHRRVLSTDQLFDFDSDFSVRLRRALEVNST